MFEALVSLTPRQGWHELLWHSEDAHAPLCQRSFNASRY